MRDWMGKEARILETHPDLTAHLYWAVIQNVNWKKQLTLHLYGLTCSLVRLKTHFCILWKIYANNRKQLRCFLPRCHYQLQDRFLWWRWAWDLLRAKGLKNIIRFTYDRKYLFQNEKKMKQTLMKMKDLKNYLPLWDKVKHIRSELGDELENKQASQEAESKNLCSESEWGLGKETSRCAGTEPLKCKERKEKRVKESFRYPWHKWFQELLNQSGWVPVPTTTTYRQAGDLVWQLPSSAQEDWEGTWWREAHSQAGPRRICN